MMQCMYSAGISDAHVDAQGSFGKVGVMDGDTAKF